MTHKLLLADDSVTIQRVIELTFADEDVQVLTAGDGEAAIARVEADRPDIVLADIGMPKRSGYDVAAFIKDRAEFAHIPVLLLTGAFEPVDEARAQAVRCDGVLVKPFEPQHVIARVRELLLGAETRRQANATRAVSDVPRPVERLAQRPPDGPPALGEPAPRTAGDEALDEYFDRLDAAFASMSGTPPEGPGPAHQPEVMPRGEGPVLDGDLDQFDAPPPPAAATPVAPPQQPDIFASASAAQVAPRGPFEWPAPEPRIVAPPPPAPKPVEPPALRAVEPPVIQAVEPAAPGPAEPAAPPPHAIPAPAVEPAPQGATLAGAFSALLAAEQGETGAAPVRFALAPAQPVITDALVEQITRRVIERLAPGAVHDVVADVVKEISEKLIREEIARLRSKGASGP